MNLNPVSFAKHMLRHLVPNAGTIVLLALFIWTQAVGAFPLTAQRGPADTRISYQGRLSDADDQPLAGSYEMAFALYTDQAGGTPFWSETHAAVAVQDGLFNVLLGSGVALPNPLPTGNLYLGVTIGGEEIAPRQMLSSTYHALEASRAASVADQSINTVQLADSAVTADKIAAASVSSVQVAEDTLTAADLAPNSVNTSELADGSVTAAKLAPDAIATGVPLGAVIPWWRPTPETPIPSGHFALADGSVVNDPESPFNGQTLPDLTGKFIMGVAPANIGSAGGSNTLDLSHSHTVSSHNHQVNSHTHGLPSHSHSVSGATGEVHNFWDGGYYTTQGDGRRFADLVYPNNNSAWYYRHNHFVDLTSGPWGGTSDGAAPLTTSASPGTDTRLSNATDNRPAYVGLVYLVRIK